MFLKRPCYDRQKYNTPESISLCCSTTTMLSSSMHHDSVSCPPALTLQKTNKLGTRRFIERFSQKNETVLMPPISEQDAVTDTAVISDRLQPIHHGPASGAKLRKNITYDDSTTSLFSLDTIKTNGSGVSSLYSRGNSSTQSSNYTITSYYSNYSAFSYASIASYRPTRRQATLGPLVLGILLFSALTVNHLEEHKEQMAQFLEATNKGIKALPFNADIQPSMLRGALGAIYMTQDYERRSDFDPVDSVAGAFEANDEDPCKKKFQTTTKDGAVVVGTMTLPNCTSTSIASKRVGKDGDDATEDK